MAHVEPSRRAPQHNAPAPAAQMPRTQSDRKHLGDRMFVAHAAVARPNSRRLAGGPGLQPRAGGPVMDKDSSAFVGLDTSKLKISVALAEEGRQGEIRFFGDIENTPDAVRRLVTKLTGRYHKLHFCYEAGPTGYGLYRQLTDLGQECVVIAPSLIPKRPGE